MDYVERPSGSLPPPIDLWYRCADWSL